MSGPKIKVDADLSSFSAEIEAMKSQIAAMGAMLQSESGKANFTFSGSAKELQALIAQAEKLTKALDSGDKKSAKYAKNLKDMAKAMADAAKISSRLENAGGSSNNNASNYFRQYAGELSSEGSSASEQANIDRANERTQARQDQEAQSRRERVSRHMLGAIGAAGNIASGAGNYSQLGSLVGGMLPGPMGFVGSQLLGGAGAFVDKYSGANKNEAIKISELSRNLGGLSVDFTALRDSVRASSAGFSITNEKAAELAKTFTQSAALSGDENYDIARSVSGSAALAQGYGISADQTVDFAASMRLNGVTKNSEDNKRLALQIGEAVGRANQSGKFAEVIESIGKFVSSSSAQNYSTPGFADYTAIITGMIGSKYSGLHGNVGNASSLIAQADAGVRGGGSRGEASQDNWLRARVSAIPGMQWQDNSDMAEQGLLGDLSAPFKPGNIVYDKASKDDQKRRDSVAKSIDESGYKNNLQLILAYAKEISRTPAEERENTKALLGLESNAQAAAIKEYGSNYQGMGELEKIIGKSLKDVDISKVAEYATVAKSSEDDRKTYYQNIKKNLSKSDLEIGEKALSAGGDELKNFLISAIEKKPNDPGLEAQRASIQLENQMAQSLDKLVGIETAAKEALLGIWQRFDKSNPVLNRMRHESGLVDNHGDNVDITKSARVKSAIEDISRASTMDEKKLIANKIRDEYTKDGGIGYPSNTEESINSELSKSDFDDKPPQSSEQATLPATTPGAGISAKTEETKKAPDYKKLGNAVGQATKPAASNNEIAPTKQANPSSKGLTKRQKSVVDMVKSETRYDSLFKEAGEKTGVDPLVVKQLAAQESGINPNATNKNSNGTTDLGMMQHNSKYAGGRGINDKNWNDPKANVMAGAKFFKTLLNKSNGNYREAFRRYNGTGDQAEKYADNAMATYNAVHSKQDKQSYTQKPPAAMRKDDGTIKDYGQKRDNVILASTKQDDFASKFSWSAIKKDTMDEKPKDFLDYLIKPAGADERDQLPKDYKPPASRSENSNMSFNHSIDVKLYDQNNRPIASPSTISTRIGAPRAAGAHS